MKKVRKTLVIVGLIGLFLVSSVSADPAVGTLFGTLSTAKAVGQGGGDFGAGVGLGDNTTAFFGKFDYGVSQYGTLGLQMGIVDPDDGGESKLSFGMNLAYQLWGMDEPDINRPFDMDIGGFLQLYPGDGFDIMHLGGFITGSHPYTMKNGSILSPYARFNVRNEKIDVDNRDSKSSLKFGLNMGVAWDMTSTTTLYGELQLDGNDGFFFGFDFNVM